MDIIIEIILDIFVRGLFKYTGATLKFIFKFKSKSYLEILDEDWNSTLGFVFIFLIITTIALIIVKQKYG
ncbi:MAG TPA: hypothetical protein VN026_08620 [Bacteroidia bacterium]|jgi:hypothetical protein|nr:hypothetical protein [Bacteroidia bacterium]